MIWAGAVAAGGVVLRVVLTIELKSATGRELGVNLESRRM